mmetsp:Transcript_12559/g.33719  ORF Transcript_12559/g.33719 Transcript_12559/m.33719 type:complete len:230 (+) Transcript_12559:467-1156(+)
MQTCAGAEARATPPSWRTQWRRREERDRMQQALQATPSSQSKAGAPAPVDSVVRATSSSREQEEATAQVRTETGSRSTRQALPSRCSKEATTRMWHSVRAAGDAPPMTTTTVTATVEMKTSLISFATRPAAARRGLAATWPTATWPTATRLVIRSTRPTTARPFPTKPSKTRRFGRTAGSRTPALAMPGRTTPLQKKPSKTRLFGVSASAQSRAGTAACKTKPSPTSQL